MDIDRRDESGTTLVEVAVAMTVVAILAFGILLGFTTADIQDREAYELTRSQNVCTSMLEQVESLSFTDLLNYTGQVVTFDIDKWHFDVTVNQLQGDLLSIEVVSTARADGSHRVRLVTLKTLKEEIL
ncbi:MAG TPA: hypothetical protein ENK43_10000 [Planctomycetes bacterium]|nr:hypothetical protein [Planctomycetota bacterium]